MGCASCSERRKQAEAASVRGPYEIPLPDGTKATVNNKAEEQTAKQQAYARMRASAARVGFRTQR